MLHVDAPLADGRMFFRTDLGQYGCRELLNEQRRQLFAKLGTCGEIACTSGSKNQTDGGASVAVDGRTRPERRYRYHPMGFNVVDG